MYTIRANGSLLYDPRVEELAVSKAALNQEDNVAGSFTFTIYPSHPLFNSIKKLSTSIEVYDGTARLFGGRVLEDADTLENARTFICEGEYAYFADSVVRPYSWAEGGVQAYLQMLIDSHNSQVGAEKQFTLGEVTVIDPNDYIVRGSSEYPSTLSELNEKLVNLLGGHIIVRKSGGVLYLDYLEDSPFMSTQTITLGKNMLDMQRTTKGSDIATAVIPLGARINDEEGVARGRVTIESVNAGVDYVADEVAREALGLNSHIFKTVVHDDVTTPERLLTKGAQDLAAVINPLASIEVTALDLKQMGLEADAFRFMEYVKVESDPHGIDGMLLITKMSTDLLNPANNKITVGSDYGTFTQNTAGVGKRVNLLENSAATIEATSQIADTVRNLSSSLTQTESSILSTVSEHYVSQTNHQIDISEVSTAIEQTSNAINFTFSELQQQITEADGDTQARFNELVKFIRFEGGDIVLGEVGNELKLRIQNDRISFTQAGVEVAYMSNNKLFITDANILYSLQIGNFAFTPRDNGNLSFNKIGGI